MITYRLSLWQQDEQQAKDLAEAIVRQKGSCDKVWLTTIGYYPSLEYHRNLANNWKSAIRIFKQAGIGVSIQMANTMGHMDFSMNESFIEGMKIDGEVVDAYVGPTGIKNSSCFCARGKKFQQYVQSVLKIYAEVVQPERFWIDDDLRPHHHLPNEYGCFCNSCVAAFNKKYGANFDRDGLVHEINFGDRAWRARFVEFTRETMYDFTYGMSKAILSVSPHSTLGVEYGPFRYYTGRDENYFLQAMHDASGKPVGVRPGGGHYNDKAPYGQYEKLFDLSLMNTSFPDYVDSIEAELENLPGVAYGKSIVGIVNEATLDLAIGCTALTFTDVQSMHEPMSYYERLFAAYAKARPYWERLAKISKDGYRCGAAVYQSATPHMAPLAEGDKPFSWAEPPTEREYNLFRLGVPMSLDARGAVSYLLRGNAVAAMSDAEIEELLAKPVLADGDAVQALIERGYGEYFPLRLVPLYDDTAQEEFTNDPINPAGHGHYFQENPYASKTKNRYYFEDLGDDARVLGKAQQNPFVGDGSCYGPCTVIVNLRRKDDKQVKWAIFGYSLWSDLVSVAKREEILGALDEISPLPVRLLSGEIASLIASCAKSGRVVCATVASVSQNGTAETSLLVRGAKGKRVTMMKADGYQAELAVEEREDGSCLVKIPPLNAYEIASVFFE
jgi:hypothetical protein